MSSIRVGPRILAVIAVLALVGAPATYALSSLGCDEGTPSTASHADKACCCCDMAVCCCKAPAKEQGSTPSAGQCGCSAQTPQNRAPERVFEQAPDSVKDAPVFTAAPGSLQPVFVTRTDARNTPHPQSRPPLLI